MMASPDRSTSSTDGSRRCTSTVQVLWIPLGAGQHVVRLSGLAFEALSACFQRRRTCELYHSALVVTAPDGRWVIEMTPIADEHGDQRGVVAEGAVGWACLGTFRTFRYEIHRWRDGVIPDADRATATTTLQLVSADAQRLLDAVPTVPTPVWGRDELGAGEMWNSNSVTSWLLHQAGIDTSTLAPPNAGRAPGWNAGLAVAARGVSADASFRTSLDRRAGAGRRRCVPVRRGRSR
jgi:hypothetical protein